MGINSNEASMSTRFQIAAKISDGTYGCIYVHCDGYPSRVLPLLQKNYSSWQQIDGLIALGDLLSLAPTIDDCDRFYGKDGEEWDDVRPTYSNTSLHDVADMHLHGDEEYRYLWDGQQWLLGEL